MPVAEPITSIRTLESQGKQDICSVSASTILETIAEPGVVLLKDCRASLSQFESFTRLFSEDFYTPSARDSLLDHTGDALTTRAPEKNFTLLAHNEGSFQPFRVPDLAFFLCLEPPARPGGESMLVDGRLFLKRLPADLRRRFEDQGVIFESMWEPQRWQSELGVRDKASVAALEKRHAGLECTFQGENLQFRYRRPVIQPDNQGVMVFANAILAHLPAINHPSYRYSKPYGNPTNRVFFGDGEQLSDDVINTLIDIQDQVALEHPLEKNDLLVIDNSRVMHGRRPTDGDCIRVLLTRFGYFRPGLGFRAA